MSFYQEITLIDHVEISPYFIWSKVYGQLHIAFVEHKNSENKVPFGVAFPEYFYDEAKKKGSLGKKIRIFAPTKEALEVLNINLWLVRLLDYVHIQSIKEVPKNVSQYAIYRRKQMKGANRVQKEIENYAAEHAKRNNVSLAEATKLYQHMTVRETHLPFIQMLSLTSDQRFKLFIEKQMVNEKLSGCLFTTYGLSASACVPEF